MEIIAITGILGTLAVIVLVILRPWDGLGRMALALFFAPRPRPRHVADPRTPQRVWDNGPVPPVGSMDYDAELQYRAMAGLPPPPDPLAEHLRRSGAELTAKLDAQRAAWAEPRPAVLLLPPDGDDSGPEWPPDGPGGGAQPPGPAGRTDGASAPPGAWRGQFDALADPEPEPPPEPPYPLPWPRAEGVWLPLPPWATEGGTWRIPPGVYDSPAEAWAAAEPEPPGAFLEPLPPGGDRLPEDDPEPESLRCPTCQSPQPSMHPATAEGGEVCHICPDPFHLPAPEWAWQPEPPEPSRLADPGELFRAELASEVLADMRARDADTARYLDRQAADLATTLNVMIRGY